MLPTMKATYNNSTTHVGNIMAVWTLVWISNAGLYSWSEWKEFLGKRRNAYVRKARCSLHYPLCKNVFLYVSCKRRAVDIAAPISEMECWVECVRSITSQSDKHAAGDFVLDSSTAVAYCADQVRDINAAAYCTVPIRDIYEVYVK